MYILDCKLRKEGFKKLNLRGNILGIYPTGAAVSWLSQDEFVSHH